jgi:hypothetical protein
MEPITSPERASSTPKRLAAHYLAVFGLFLLLYGLTCQRGVAWQDSAIFQWRILTFDPVGWLGLALSHPLSILTGKAFSGVPLGSLPWRMNMISSVAAALAAANLALLVRRLAPRRPLASWMTAGLFGLAHTPWWLATICESQMVYAAVFSLELNVAVSLLRRPRGLLVLALGAVNGLGLTAHNLALLALPVYALTMLALCRRQRLPWAALLLLPLGWAVGAGGFLLLVVHQAQHSGLPAAVQSALFGRSWQGAVLGFSPASAAHGLGYILYNFPNAGLPLAAVGAAVLWRGERRLAGLLAALTAIHLAFAVRYSVADQFMFFVPTYAAIAVLAGVGMARVEVCRGPNWRPALLVLSLLAGPILYAAAPPIARAAHLPLPGRKDLPFRDHARYWLSPWKSGEDSAEQFARAVLAEAPDGATVVADGTSYYPLLLTARMEKNRPDVTLLRDASPRALPPGTPKVFLVSSAKGYHPSWLDEAADFRKHGQRGILLEVVWRSGARAAPASAGRRD